MIQDSTNIQKRFILIDDDPTYRTVILRAAELEGMNLDVYESLMDLGAVGLLDRYDAAIVDFDLGNINGVEIAEYLCALFGDIPMILISEKNRSPGTQGWPASIKSFVHKSQGYAFALRQAKRFARSRALHTLKTA